jgi:tetratricopeptide (TPR) repeat protein
MELAAGRDAVMRGLHSTLGGALGALGRHAEALEQKSAAVTLARAGADLHALADTLEGVGSTLSTLGRFDEAEVAWAEAAELYERLGHVRAPLLVNRAEAALDRGDPAAARVLAAEAARAASEGHAALILAMARAVEGRAILEAGDAATALPLMDEAFDGLPDAEVRARAQLDLSRAIAWARLGRPGARGLLIQAAAVLDRADDAVHVACVRGEIEAALGNLEAARAAVAEAESHGKPPPRIERLLAALRVTVSE